MKSNNKSFICIKIIIIIFSLTLLNLKVKLENTRLFSKYILNNKVQVPGLLTIAPITLFGSNPDGSISEEERNYLNGRAKNIGLYILGGTAVSQEGIAFPNMPRALSEKDLDSLKERAKIIKEQGALAINQIFHGGALAESKYSGMNSVAVSAEIYNKGLSKKDINNGIAKKQLNNEDILRIIKDFAYATELSIKAGFDGIEIHGANKFLLQQFYSGYYNKRKDEWGGSLEKRMRFPLEVVDACCKIRDKYNKPEFIFQKARRGEGTGIERLKLIHKETKGKVALIGVGGLFSYKDFNKALKSEFSDFIATARASMMNKYLGTLLKEERVDEINLLLDPVHPEKYSLPNLLWASCVKGGDSLPPLKRK